MERNPDDEAGMIQYLMGMENDQVAQRAENRALSLGDQVIKGLVYGNRGADHTLDALIAFPKGENTESFQTVMVEAVLCDMALWPRIVELEDRTFSWQVQGGLGGLIESQIVATNRLYQDCGKGLGLGFVKERQESRERKDSLGTKLDEARKQADLTGLVGLEIDALAEGLNHSILDRRLEGYLADSVLVAEDIRVIDKGMDEAGRTNLRHRLREKRRQLKIVQQAVGGFGLCVQFLDVLVPASTDIGAISEVFTSSHVKKLPTHAMRLMSLSPNLKYGTTVAMGALLGLEYWKDEQPTGPLAEMGHKMSLSAMKGGEVTIDKRDKFLSDLEEVVVKKLEGRGVKNALQIGESSTALAIMFHEILTLGGTGSVRDRKTGRVINIKVPKKDGEGNVEYEGEGADKKVVMVDRDYGSGTLYSGFGASDAEEKLHRARDRKTGEARKGRPAPRPMIAKAMSQELLFGILQYNEAKVKDGDSQRGLGMSILEALTDEKSNYDMGNMLEQLGESDQFIYMLFAFRAVQIVETLEKLPIGRIEVISELGGGPERIVQEMIDATLKLHKAFQTIPYVGEGREMWKRDKLAGEIKNAEVARNMINLWSEFIRASRAVTAGTGGYTDNPEWVGFVDRLRPRIYERLVVYTNAMTAQQFQMAWLLGGGTNDNKNVTSEFNNLGGVITEEMLVDNDPISEGVRKVLSQDPAEDPESLVNISFEAGYEGYETDEGKRRELLGKLINKSASEAEVMSAIPHSIKVTAGFDTETIDGKNIKDVRTVLGRKRYK